jgi:hypothetical protein
MGQSCCSFHTFANQMKQAGTNEKSFTTADYCVGHMKGKGPTQTVTLYLETLFTPSQKTVRVKTHINFVYMHT